MNFFAAAELFLTPLWAVFVVVDPVGVVPVFVALTARDPRKRARSVAARACVTSTLVLVFFALVGASVLKVLGISLDAFKVAGGALLAMTALDMLRARQSPTRTTDEETREGIEKEDVALVPLAIPLLAGPGAIATVMVLMARSESIAARAGVLVAVVVTLAASYWVFRSASLVQRVLGTSGLAVLGRVMGLILAAVGVQFIAEGTRALLG